MERIKTQEREGGVLKNLFLMSKSNIVNNAPFSEETLSDKITNEVFNETHILTEDVKEFIQKIKEKIKLNSDADQLISYGEAFELIDEEAGEKLS